MKYQIVYADPPWKYDDEQNNDPARGGITYPTMTDEQICNLEIPDISSEDCALFLWATMPKLESGLSVVKAWGFRYVTTVFVWVKQNPTSDFRNPQFFYPADKEAFNLYSGLGHWTNSNVEVVLMGRRGSLTRQQKDVKQIILAPRSRHSAKPPETRDRIVRLMGDLPRVELFARETVPGWDAIGNGIDGMDIAESIQIAKVR